MNTPAAIGIGVLAPLSRPGWVEAGRHLLTGIELAVHEVNAAGGIHGRPLELTVRDTAADPQRAEAAIEELAALGVAAVVGEYHSVVARAATARADALGVPFLCSSAVLDSLTEHPTDLVARIAPAQSHSWRVYADFLLAAGHRHLAVAVDPSVYWSSGIAVLRSHLAPHGGTVTAWAAAELDPAALADSGATALLLLTGFPDRAVGLVRTLRHDARLAGLLIGAPAGQPEFAEWAELLGADGDAVPFLRYLPKRPTPRQALVEAQLRDRLASAPSFVAFEGHDTVTVLAEALRTHGTDRDRLAAAWPQLKVEGTRGTIRFSRVPGIGVHQWAWPPVQVAERDPAAPDGFRVLHTG
ncbi:ABC-type branched-subunit amino acid transport system substrate-binding protein [Kitasatospora gansuensis]|uniref:ABC-type branched-subunit amino acid transport system substrate-binding protein n=1 Tax=Kitasatospora gansuensis TaxID=258050 RepID=A0A7W7SJ03_9ACTN|nr:ABC transporter substrate-binding protein [Kitasatospora gansuensis]MBB4951242.1 ABC-type branched-subunit amino acid transport system substrate-binding protein [Kitasatospora gansuensis]